MYGKSNMETYITICEIDSQQEFAVWLRKLKQGVCINLEGWCGEGDWREVQKVGDMYIPISCGSDSKASVYNMGDLGSSPGLGRSPGEGNGNPLQYYFSRFRICASEYDIFLSLSALLLLYNRF